MDHHLDCRREACGSIYFDLRREEENLQRNFYISGLTGWGGARIDPSLGHRQLGARPPGPLCSLNAALPDRVQRVRDALEESEHIALHELQQRFAGLDLSAIGRILLDACHDIALYFGGSVVAGAFVGGAAGSFFAGAGTLPGALLGAGAGAQAGGAILGFLGLVSLAETLTDAIPDALAHYKEGFALAWGPLSPYDGSFEPTSLAARRFAQGHMLIVIAALASLTAYLTRGRGDRAAIFAEIRNSPKLGPKVADWVMMNEDKLVRHPALQPRNGGGGSEVKPAREAAATPSRASKRIEEAPEPKRSNKEGAIFGEARGREYMEKDLGMKRLTGDKNWNAPGIDDIYKNPKPPPDYVIVDHKYRFGKQGNTRDGLQLSDDWVHGKNTGRKRLGDAVGERNAAEIRNAMQRGRVEKWLIRVDESGNVTKSLLDGAGRVVRGN